MMRTIDCTGVMGEVNYRQLSLPGAENNEVVSQVFCSFSIRSRRIEPCGKAFYDAFELTGIFRIVNSKAKIDLENETHRGQNEQHTTNPKQPGETSKKNQKEKMNDNGGLKYKDEMGEIKGNTTKVPLSKLHSYLKRENFYALLGISQAATNPEIRKAYLNKALNLHPDKATGSAIEETNELFVQLKDAYEALLDPEFRLAYDSALPADDSLPDPTSIKNSCDFYEIFGNAFDKNARWSVKIPVPRLGDDSTNLETVEAFYRFWMAFESKRDFTSQVLDEIEDPCDRRDKRRLDRERKRANKKHVDAESQRIRKLVEMAYKLDPRVIIIKRNQELEKERTKQEKKNRKKMWKEKQNETFFGTDALQNVQLEKTGIDEKSIGAPKLLPSQTNVSLAMSDAAEGEKPIKELKTDCRSVSTESKTHTENPWRAAEISLLTSLTTKYPVGTTNRWGAIAKHMPGRSEQEVMACIKRLSKPNVKYEMKKQEDKLKPINEHVNTGLSVPPSTNQWTEKEQQDFEEALTLYRGNMPRLERWAAVAAKVKTKNAQQCLLRFEEIRSVVVSRKVEV